MYSLPGHFYFFAGQRSKAVITCILIEVVQRGEVKYRGVLYNAGIMFCPAMGAALMSISAIVVALNARMLKIKITAKCRIANELKTTGHFHFHK
jgi:hypothetical protein